MTEAGMEADETAAWCMAAVARFVERALGPGDLADRTATVLASLPVEVRRDLLDDPGFHLALDDYDPRRGRRVWVPFPSPAGSRLVVLKAHLAVAPPPFAAWVVAHELAHAYLRNGGWGAIGDREHAADALALSWGYPRPPAWW
ncbi:MAG: hypothetical protein ACRC1K_23510 [Planctomycetia bacterium]